MASDAATDLTGLVDIGMPRLSDSMEEATVLQWLKSPGEQVAKGEPLVEVETDKATIVYEAEADGLLEEIVVAAGNAAALGDVIARLRVADGGSAPPPAVSAPRPAEPAPPTVVAAAPPHHRVTPAAKGARARATPVARALAAQLGVPLDGLSGTGIGGRIVRADIRAAAPRRPVRPTGAATATELRAHAHAADDRRADEPVARHRARVHARGGDRRWRPRASLRAELQAAAGRARAVASTT